MSTLIYLQCLDHIPPLRSSSEVGHNLNDLPSVRAMIQSRETYVTALNSEISALTFSSHYVRTAVQFLYNHQECCIGIVDEHGIQHPNTATCLYCEIRFAMDGDPWCSNCKDEYDHIATQRSKDLKGF